MQEAGEQGVLLIALGTVTETSKPIPWRVSSCKSYCLWGIA